MAKLICKYCGKELIPSDSGVRTINGPVCLVSPTKKHVGTQNAPHCIYCGYECRSAGTALTKVGGGPACSASPTQKHVAAQNAPHCIYCGHECRSAGNELWKVGGGPACSASPNKKHALG
jgi:hypothetical protein